VRRGDDRHVGRDHRSVADSDLRVIHQRAVEINVDVAAQMNVMPAPHRVIWHLDIRAIAIVSASLLIALSTQLTQAKKQPSP
jgi:hypothetical protein